MEEGLKIRISADTQQAVAGISKVDQALKRVVPASGRATTAMTNLGRVVQDAPFGFIGIANNIDPLLQSFQSLSKESGGSGKALKALASSMLGPAGIAVALSAISSLVIVAIQKYGSLGNAINALVGNMSNLEKANLAISESFTKAAGKAAGEVAQIRALVEVARNESLSRGARTQALSKLNDEYKDYLPALNEENISTQRVQQSIDKLTDSIIRQAKIKGLQELISKKTAEQAEIYAKALNTLEQKATGVQKVFDMLANPQLMGSGITARQVEIYKLGKEYDNATQQLKVFDDALRRLTTKEAEAGTLYVKPGKIKQASSNEIPEMKVRPAIVLGVNEYEQLRRIGDIISGQGVKGDLGEKIVKPLSDLSAILKADGEKAGIAAYFQIMNDKATQLATTVSETLQPVFMTLFDSIGKGGKNMLQSIVDVLGQIIKRLAAAALQAAVFAAIMTAIGVPGGGGFGQIFTKQFAGLTGFNLGGTASPARGAALNMAPIVLETQVRGQDLYLVNRRYENSLNRMG